MTFPTTYYYVVTAVSVMESCPTAAVGAAPLATTPPGPKVPGATSNNLAHRCGCSSISQGARPLVALFALVALAVLVRRK